MEAFSYFDPSKSNILTFIYTVIRNRISSYGYKENKWICCGQKATMKYEQNDTLSYGGKDSVDKYFLCFRAFTIMSSSVLSSDAFFIDYSLSGYEDVLRDSFNGGRSMMDISVDVDMDICKLFAYAYYYKFSLAGLFILYDHEGLEFFSTLGMLKPENFTILMERANLQAGLLWDYFNGNDNGGLDERLKNFTESYIEERQSVRKEVVKDGEKRMEEVLNLKLSFKKEVKVRHYKVKPGLGYRDDKTEDNIDE